MNPITSNDSTAVAGSSVPIKLRSMSKTPLLNASQIRQRIQRLAWQLYEDNSGEQEIVLAGIVQTGHQVALKLAEALREISPLKVTVITVKIDKHRQVAGSVELSVPGEEFKGKVVVLVDDVLNSGKTLLYAMKPFLQIDIRKLRTVVLVDRNHRRFPITADFSGMTLATTLKEHITVEEVSGELEAFIE